MQDANRFSELTLRWTFGENKERPTSLQAYDMLYASVLFAKRLFPGASFRLYLNNLSTYAKAQILRLFEHELELVFVEKKEWEGIREKNSFWKYIPLRSDTQKYELLLDNDFIIWKIPQALINWYMSDKLLINSDWNGQHYGSIQVETEKALNAGLLGYCPGFSFALPTIEEMSDYFLSEQGFISQVFTTNSRELLIIPREDIFQSNALDYIDSPIENLVKRFLGGHFCGCSYAHYVHWDKYYKKQVWDLYYKSWD